MPKMFGAKFPLPVLSEKITYATSLNTIGAGLTRWLMCVGTGGGEVGGAVSASELSADNNFLVTYPGIIRNLVVKASAAPGAGETFVYTIRVNQVNTALTVTLSGAAQVNGSDLVNTVTVAVGDRITLQVVTSAAAVETYHAAVILIKSKVAKKSFRHISWCTRIGTIAAGLTRYPYTHGRMVISSTVIGTVETDAPANYLSICKDTIANLVVLAGAAPGVGQSFVYTLRVNGVASALTVTVSGAAQITGSDITNVVRVVVSDRVTLQVVTSAAAAVTTHVASVDFEEGDYRAG